MSAPTQTTRVLCERCKVGTHHQVVAEHRVHGTVEEDSFHWAQTNQIVQCAGCDIISFVRISTDSESYDYETGKPDLSIELYPEREPKPQVHSHREEIECADTFPTKTRRIYREVIRSLSANLPILTAIGIRAIIESICIEQKAAGSNLEKKIDDLATKGLLAKGQATILHGLRFMGNFAAHEIESPKPTEIMAALDIAETLLKTIYFLPDLATSIQSGRPLKSAPPAVAPVT